MGSKNIKMGYMEWHENFYQTISSVMSAINDWEYMQLNWQQSTQDHAGEASRRCPQLHSNF